MDGEGTCDWGGETDKEWGFGEISRFMRSSMGGTMGNDSRAGKSDKNPGGAVCMCGAGTMVSIEFINTEGGISSMEECMEETIALDGSTMSTKTGELSCINWLCRMDAGWDVDAEFGINVGDISDECGCIMGVVSIEPMSPFCMSG
jgi:hypothetical protein